MDPTPWHARELSVSAAKTALSGSKTAIRAPTSRFRCWVLRCTRPRGRCPNSTAPRTADRRRNQYARSKRIRCRKQPPHRTRTPDSATPSSGTHRGVAVVRALMSPSQRCCRGGTSTPSRWRLLRRSRSSCARQSCARRWNRFARWSRNSGTRRGLPAAAQAERPAGPSLLLVTKPARYTTVPLSRSRGPSSTRTSTPLNSQSLNLGPGET